MRINSQFSVLLIFVLFSLASGCGRRETPVEKAEGEQILLMGNGYEPADLDPQIATGVSELNILFSLYEGLTSPDPENLKPEPGVARDWEISDDGRVYTFHLRSDARWSNGAPLTAEDFIFSYQRILSPALGAANAELFFTVENAERFHRGIIRNFSRVGIKAEDSKTLRVTLKAPTPYFLSLLMHPAWFPVFRDAILEKGAAEKRATGWTQPGKLVGNGPFLLRQWKVNEIVEVVKNPFYWDAERVRLNGIRFFPIANLNTEELAFRAGQLHLTEALPSSKIEDYRSKNSPFLRLDPYLGTYYYLLNIKSPPLQDRSVRRALSMAIDRESIVRNVTRGGQRPASRFTPPDIAGYNPETEIVENATAARALLAEAGFPGGRDFPVLEILFNTSENHKLIAEAIQQMWKRNLGIEVKLVNQEAKVYFASRANRDYAIARSSWIGDYIDPSSFLSVWTTNSGNNHSGWSNPQYDRLLEEASLLPAQKDRYERFRAAEKILLEESPLIPIYFYVTAYLIRPSVRNWRPTLLDWHPYKYLFLDPSLSESGDP